MNILGINVSHNASAALMINGKVVLAIQEERFTKIKNFAGYPKLSVDYCLDYLKTNGLVLDKVAFSTFDRNLFWLAYPISHYFKMKDYVNHYGTGYYDKLLKNEDVSDYYKEIASNGKNKADTYLPYNELTINELLHDTEKSRELQKAYAAKQCNVDPSNISFIDHHTCHAYYGYFAGRKKSDNCAVITLDSIGDGLNQTVWHFNGNNIKKLRTSKQADIARIYKLVTLILGMKPDEHEYKVMGMAPYAKSDYVNAVYKDVFEPILKVEDATILHNNRPADLYQYLQEKLKPYRFDNIAGAVQKLVEEICINLITQVHELTGARHFCLSGGVSMNIKVNMLVSALDFVDGLTVPASGSDESLCMGACYYVAHRNKVTTAPLDNVYLGFDVSPEITEENIQKQFDSKLYDIKRDVKASEVAQLLANGEVIAVVRKREEFGARALGNRSILANPVNPDVIKIINEAIKNRDFWMPFALSILDERANDYLVNPKEIESPYMTIGFETIEEGYPRIKAGTHPYDKTCRPQILKKEHNPDYHNLISEFEKITNIPGLLNTSLNLHGDPICSRLKDAHYTLENSGLKHLYLNDSYLISKKV